jgi:hypothetical protein
VTDVRCRRQPELTGRGTLANLVRLWTLVGVIAIERIPGGCRLVRASEVTATGSRDASPTRGLAEARDRDE